MKIDVELDEFDEDRGFGLSDLNLVIEDDKKVLLTRSPEPQMMI